MKRTVFYVSDSTGITAETIGHSILTQFGGVEFDTHRIPFVNAPDKAEAAARRIKKSYADTGVRPIVVNTVVDSALSEILGTSGGLIVDLFAPFMALLERELDTERSPAVNLAHGVVDSARYEARIGATNYALSHDDGVSINYDDAEVVLVGVSRVGKTPTCLYMALQYGVRAANYPLTEEDLNNERLPQALRESKGKLYALTLEPQRLAQIRDGRRPGSRYSSLRQCRWELQAADAILRREGVPMIDSTHISIEEIASKILAEFGIEKHMF